MVIPVIGPSKAGKTETTRMVIETLRVMTARRCDLDEELGHQERSNGARAVEFIQSCVNSTATDHVIVDIGAGQLVSDHVSQYLRAFPEYPSSVVVIWCDKASFCLRHGDNWSNEVSRYYGNGLLTEFWRNARTVGRLVDTSGPFAPSVWAQKLAAIIVEMTARKEGTMW